MKDKGPILVLLLVAIGLGIALIVVNREAADQRKTAAENAVVASNNFASAKKQLAELQTVNQTLETNLQGVRIDLSNKLALSEASLHAAEANLEKAAAEAKAELKAQADSNALELAQRDKKISALESQNQDLDKEAASLRAAITNLDSRIMETQAKLAKSEGDYAFLSKELKALQAEKADMEKRFNDIAAVRDQLRKLKQAAVVARQLDWERRGLYATFKAKGAELLLHPLPSAPPADNSAANVELRQHGGAKIQTSPATNAPPK